MSGSGGIDVLILCGGLGTRLAPVVDRLPKSLAPVLDRPFLDYILDYLLAVRHDGSVPVQKCILACGHLASQIEDRYGDSYGAMPLAYSVEKTPLGTGGAILHAMRETDLSAPFLLMNGDSFLDADIGALMALHRATDAGVTLALYHAPDCARFGTVTAVGDCVTGFLEKTGKTIPGWINGGIYMVQPRVLLPWKDRNSALSMETDILPSLVADDVVRALHTGSRFIDIGLPETYRGAASFFAAGS